MDTLVLQIKKALKEETKSIEYNQINIQEHIIAHIQNEFNTTQFTLDETIKYINTFNTHTCIHTMYTLGPICINILTNNYLDIPPKLLMERVIKRLFIVYTIFKINTSVNYWLIPTDSNRWFPKKNIVTPEHINGGFTYVKQSSNNTNSTANIYIYRREEFPKVMLHELMHHSYIDSNNNDNTIKSIDTIAKICDIDTNTVFLPNEGIIEAWALILQLIFISHEYNIPFDVLFKKEKQWSMKQSSRLLYYKKNSTWKESTNSYCYIVIKTCCIYNIEQFVNSCFNKTVYRFLEQNIEDFLKKIKPMPMKHSCFRMTAFGDL